MSEKLSNLLDKNVDESELQDFLRECKNDPSLIDSWQRYHLAGAVIRDEVSESELKFDIATKVMDRLGSETLKSEQVNTAQINKSQTANGDSNVVSFSPAPENDSAKVPARSKSALSKPWFPIALAASMLLGIYFIFQQPVIDPVGEQVANQVSDQVADDGSVDNALTASVDHWQTSSREIENVLNSLLVEHSEFTSVTGMNGLGSYSKFIAYQN